MGRRNQDENRATAIAQLIGLVAIGFIFIPQFRPIALLALVIIVMVVVIFLIFHAAKSGGNQLSNDEGADRFVRLDSSPTAKPATTNEDLIRRLRTIDWFQFEKVVAILYEKRGYRVTRRGGANADGGIDLIVEKDGERSAVQCKQWKTWNVGVKAVREFVGALTVEGIGKGIFITLNGYTDDAKQLAERRGIVILNERDLGEMLRSTDARFDPVVLELLNDLRKSCPKCENEMVLRTAAKGNSPGSQFWGCSTYPRCRYTMRCE